MTDAPRIDLNYGHSGEPHYDPESQEWNFSRNIADVAPKFRVLGQARTLLSSQLSEPTEHPNQTAFQRRRNIDQLIFDYPELAPSSRFLPSLLEASEVIQETTAAYDHTLSDRLAYGRALYPGHHREDAKTVPVVAVVGGAAGEIVRAIQMVPETFNLDGVNFQIKDDVFQSRVQGLWFGNGSPIQQLQFAESNGEPTEWLGVRHGGATSVLRLILREVEVPTLCNIFPLPVFDAEVQIRIELEHIVTLPRPATNDALHTDICFNPWTPLELAVLDQSSRWVIWKIKCINRNVGVWTVEAGLSGALMEQTPNDATNANKTKRNYDGWGALRFINHGAGLLVCNRRDIARFALRKQPASSSMPEIGIGKSKDWILDLRQGSASSEDVFVTTTSHIIWIHLPSEYVEGTEQAQFTAKIELAWAHFRNAEDISLSTQVVSVLSRTIVLLHSRLTGLMTLFTLDRGRHLPCLDSEPHLLQIPGHDESKGSRCSTLILRAISPKDHKPYGQDGLDPLYWKNGVWLLKCVTLHTNLSLQEFLLAASPPELEQTMEVRRCPGRALTTKSSYRVRDDFIIADGLSDVGVQERAVQTSRPDDENVANRSDLHNQVLPPSGDQWTLSLQWLTDRIDSPWMIPLDQALQLISDTWSDDYNLSDQGVPSLVELMDDEVGIGDIDQDSTELQSFLSRMTKSPSAKRGEMSKSLPRWISIARLTSPSLLPSANETLTQVYDVLVDSWIASLTATVPNRIRSTTEKLIRHVATQLQLASYGLRLHQLTHEPERKPHESGEQVHLKFTLPVRQMPTVPSMPQTAGSGQDYMFPASSQMSEDEDVMPAGTLPTPEPTPSVQSQRSRWSVGEGEDMATQRLRAVASVGSQRGLPSVLTGILSHWSVGQDPDMYDWEASKMVEEQGHNPDEPIKTRAPKRRKHERVSKVQGQDLGGSSSQPMPPRLAASQMEMPIHIQDSSQQTPVTMSQPQPGRHGGGRKVRKAKKAGF